MTQIQKKAAEGENNAAKQFLPFLLFVSFLCCKEL